MFFRVDDTQLDLYAPENRGIIDFDFFKRSEKSVSDFKKTLQNVDGEGENSFFDSVIYGLMSRKIEGKKNKKRKSERGPRRKIF